LYAQAVIDTIYIQCVLGNAIFGYYVDMRSG
jgi:hypothetical protein